MGLYQVLYVVCLVLAWSLVGLLTMGTGISLTLLPTLGVSFPSIGLPCPDLI